MGLYSFYSSIFNNSFSIGWRHQVVIVNRLEHILYICAVGICTARGIYYYFIFFMDCRDD